MDALYKKVCNQLVYKYIRLKEDKFRLNTFYEI
jgi:hypothetical protein